VTEKRRFRIIVLIFLLQMLFVCIIEDIDCY